MMQHATRIPAYALLVLSALLSGCMEARNNLSRDTISAELGSAVQFNKACQINRVAAPEGCHRAVPTGQAASEAATGYNELTKQTSTLRVNDASVSGVGSAPAPAP